jgi:uncharacterized membrane protein
MTLLPIHIIGGITGIISGFLAIYAAKGAKLHRKSGMIFVYGMLALSITGTVMAVMKSQRGNVIGGLITFYLVTTGLLTLRRRDEKSVWIDASAMVLGIAIGVLAVALGLEVLHSASGRIDGVPPAPLFVFGAVALLAGLGDIRMILSRGLQGRHRLVRHLWRMCFSLFIASGSFFLGQAKVFPKPMRIYPLLAIPALLPLVFLLYWLVRVSLTKWRPPRSTERLTPGTVGHFPRAEQPAIVAEGSP